MPEVNASARNQYLEADKSFNIQNHLKQLEKEEKSGLKGIEIRDSAKQLGKDDFLKLLISQLSQQDPTNPMKDQEFIAQMAQFSSLEQMKNISTGISRMEAKQAYSVVGKIISGPDLVTGEDVIGVAGAIFFDNQGKTYARVNGRTVDIEKINLISDPNLVDKPLGETTSNSLQSKKPISDTEISNKAITAESNNASESEVNSINKSSDKNEVISASGENTNSTATKNSSEMDLIKKGNSYMDLPGYRPLGGKNLPYAD